MLEAIASDLGVSATVLRKHPFFRVLKGRVLLTYPLKSYPIVWKTRALKAWSKLSPTTDTFYEVATLKNAKIIFLKIGHDEAADRFGNVRITADDLVYEGTNQYIKDGVVHYAFKRFLALDDPSISWAATATLAEMDIEGVDILIEAKVSSLTAGKTLSVAILYAEK